MDAIKNRLGDIGVVTTVFHSSKLPLNNLPYYTPFTSRNPVLVSQVMDELAEKFPAFQKQFDDQNQMLLTNYSSIDNYGIFTKARSPRWHELKGLKINAAGPNALYLKPLGAVGRARQPGDLLQSDQDRRHRRRHDVAGGDDHIQDRRGRAALSQDRLRHRRQQVAHHQQAGLGRLPDEVKKVLKDVAVEYRDKVAQAALDKADASIKKFKEMGGTITQLSDADKKKWADSMPNIAQNLAGRSREEERLSGQENPRRLYGRVAAGRRKAGAELGQELTRLLTSFRGRGHVRGRAFPATTLYAARPIDPSGAYPCDR